MLKLGKVLAMVTGFLFHGALMGGELRVASYNIHHGVGLDGKLDLDRIAEVLEGLDADVIALQEVDKGCERSGGVDQAKYLAGKLGMTFVFGKAIDLGDGEYGQAILSRYPIKSSVKHLLPSEGEQRIVLEGRVLKDGVEIPFCSVHLDHRSDAVRGKQAEAFLQKVKKHPRLILCGDFNAKPDSKTMKLFRKTTVVVPKEGARKTFPANEPRVEIDYCVVRLAGVKAATKVVDEAVASDHRPLVTELRWE